MAEHHIPPSDRETHASHGTFLSYGFGFGLSVVLTVIPFALVMYPVVSPQLTMGAVVVVAIAQVVTQMYYFLHLDRYSERWNFISLYFTVLIVAVLVVGSLWIMGNAMQNMMLGHMPMPQGGL